MNKEGVVEGGRKNSENWDSLVRKVNRYGSTEVMNIIALAEEVCFWILRILSITNVMYQNV